MRIGILILLVTFCMNAGTTQSVSTFKEYNKVFTTYDFSDPDPIPNATKIYPYFRYDGYAHQSIQKEWKVVELENEYLKVMILPQIGGKIWAAIDKKLDTSFIYFNHVVKFRDVAMRGPWTSGGIEANYGIIGHTPNCATPVDYKVIKNEDGSVSCTIGVLDLLSNTQWRMEINLPKDKAYFTTRSFWYNTSGIEQPFYHWMNVGIKVDGQLEYIYPGNYYIGHDGDHHSWPVNEKNRKDLSFYDNNDFGGYKSYHVFGKLTNFFGAYYHKNDFGMVRYANYDEKAGKKIWIWGLSRQGMIWEKYLTDHDGQYSEVQSGRLFNQNAEKSMYSPFKHHHFSPYGTDDWKEYWYAVSNTKGITTASNFGAFNLLQGKNKLHIFFDPVLKMEDTLSILNKRNEVVFKKQFSILPHQLLADSFPYNGSVNDLQIKLGNNQYSFIADSNFYSLNRPVDAPTNFDWNTSYGLYVKGRSYMDQKMFSEAESNLVNSIKIDSNYLPSMVQLAMIKIRNFKYQDALSLLKKAISIDTHDAQVNYYYGLVNELLNKNIDATDGYSIASISSEYKSAAYTSLARLFLKNGAYNKCLAYSQKAIEFNARNIIALQLQLVAYRKSNNIVAAHQTIKSIQVIDPLNHFSAHEKHLITGEKNDVEDFIYSIKNEMPNETKFQIAAEYVEMGLHKEALEVISHCDQTALTNYWSAYLSMKLHLPYQNYLNSAKSQSPDFVFPNRAVDFDVLNWILNVSDDWKARYFLAILYRDRNRLAEAKELVRSLKELPNYAPFYVFSSQLFDNQDENAVLQDLKQANKLEPEHWRYVKHLVEYYIIHKNYTEALNVVEPFFQKNQQNYIIGMLYAKSLILNQRYLEANVLLAKLNIIPFEGATQGHELYREVKINLALIELNKKDYKKAKRFLEEAQLWPENLGVGMPYKEDIDDRLENWIAYLIAKAEKSSTAIMNNLLNKIVAFTPAIDNTVANFYTSNHWVTYLAFSKMGKESTGKTWLSNQLSKHPKSTSNDWLKNKIDKTNSSISQLKIHVDVTASMIDKLPND